MCYDRKMKKILISLFILSFIVVNTFADNHKSPWKLLQGHWQFEEEYGFKSEVVYEKLNDGEGAIGKWADQDGNKFTALIGWMPELKKLVALGFGTNGAYWECNFTDVTSESIKGTMIYRDTEGKVQEGNYMIKRISDNYLESEFKTKDPEDGKFKILKGTIKKVVKKKE